jgi:hypothetical protein
MHRPMYIKKEIPVVLSLVRKKVSLGELKHFQGYILDLSSDFWEKS